MNDFTLFRPSRKLRREAAGQPCVVCGNRLHFSDLVAVAGPTGTSFGHLACFEFSLAQAEAQSAQSDPDQGVLALEDPEMDELGHEVRP